jgi:hypothetical protein
MNKGFVLAEISREENEAKNQDYPGISNSGL